MSDKDRTTTGSIDISDRQGLLEYGLAAQTALSDFSGDLLDQMRKAKTGDVEYPLERLMMVVRSVEIGDIGSGKKAEKRLVKQMGKTMLRYGKTDQEMFHLEMELDALRSELLRDIVRLGKLKEKNQTHQQVLEGLINAGEKTLVAQEKRDLEDLNHPVHILEKRIHDLKLARMISVQMSPQLDLIMNASQTLVDKIQTSLLTTIPLWRSQMTIAIALLKQKSAAELEKMVFSDAADTLSANNEALKAELEQLKSGGGSAEVLNRLKQTGEMLLQTIGECQQISGQSAEELARTQAEITKVKKEIK